MGKITSSDGLPCIQFLVFSTPPLVLRTILRTENLDRDESKLTAAKNPKMLCAPSKKKLMSRFFSACMCGVHLFCDIMKIYYVIINSFVGMWRAHGWTWARTMGHGKKLGVKHP